MKIVYFHQHFSTPLGATGIRSYEMAKALIANGHQVTIICGSYSGGNTGLVADFKAGQRSGVVDGINIIEFQLNYANNQTFIERTKTFLSFAYHSIKYALSADYDVIFCTTTPLTAALPGIFARWLRRKHFIFEVRDLWPELPKAMGVITNPVILSLMSILEWSAYKSAHQLIALSPGIAKGIKRHTHQTKKVTLIPNGCDIELFDTQEPAWAPNEIKDSDFLAIFSGTHGIANGLDNVLNLAKTLEARNINHIKILLIGQGKLKASLQKRVQNENITNIIFHEPVNKAKLAQLMKRANVGLQVLANIPAFYYGTSPNKFFDYISAGLPVINNYPGWLAQLISQHNCGIAVEADNANAFADALITLSNDPSGTLTKANNAKLLASTTFDRKILARQFVECFNNIGG